MDAWVDALWARHERVWDTAHFPDLSLPFDPNTMTWEPHDPRADTAMTWAANVLSANAHDLGLAAIGSKFEDDLDNERYWRAGTRAVMRALGWTVTRLLPRLGPAAEGTALPPGTEVLGEPPPSPWEAFGDPTNSFGDPVTTVAGAFPPAPSNVVRWAQDYDAETERLRPPDGADDDAVKQWMLNDSRREPVWGLSARIPPVAVHGPFAEGTSAAGMVLDAYDVALDPNVEQLLAIPFEGDEEMYLGVLEGYLKENHVAAYPSESMTVEDLVAITKDDYPAIAVVSRPGGEVGYVTVDGVVTTKGLDGELVTLITFRDPATGKRVLESVDKFAAHFLGRGLATRGYHP